MLKLLHNLRRREWTMAAVCTVLILGQIYFDLSLPDYMSNLTVLIKTPGSNHVVYSGHRPEDAGHALWPARRSLR